MDPNPAVPTSKRPGQSGRRLPGWRPLGRSCSNPYSSQPPGCVLPSSRSPPGGQDAAMAVPRPFYARHFGVCEVCDAPIKRGHPVAYQNDKPVHVEHHDDATVKGLGKAMPAEPPRRKKWKRYGK